MLILKTNTTEHTGGRSKESAASSVIISVYHKDSTFQYLRAVFSPEMCKEQKGRNEEIQKLKYLQHLHSIPLKQNQVGIREILQFQVIQYNTSLPVTIHSITYIVFIQYSKSISQALNFFQILYSKRFLNIQLFRNSCPQVI